MTKSGISQSQAGYIGFAALLSCVPANLIVGALGGTFPTRKVYSHVISSDDFKGGCHRALANIQPGCVYF